MEEGIVFLNNVGRDNIKNACSKFDDQRLNHLKRDIFRLCDEFETIVFAPFSVGRPPDREKIMERVKEFWSQYESCKQQKRQDSRETRQEFFGYFFKTITSIGVIIGIIKVTPDISKVFEIYIKTRNETKPLEKLIEQQKQVLSNKEQTLLNQNIQIQSLIGLLKEDGGHLLKESGQGLLIEKSLMDFRNDIEESND